MFFLIFLELRVVFICFRWDFIFSCLFDETLRLDGFGSVSLLLSNE